LDQENNDMPINFSGLASGLDTGAIVDSLVSIERARANTFNERKFNTEKQISTIGSLSSIMKDLDSKLDSFSTKNEIRQMSVESTNEDRVIVTSSGAATAGNFAMTVTKLARNETSQSQTYATADAGVVGTGTLDLTVGSEALVSIAYDATDSLYEIAERITNSDAKATASVLFDGTDYRIMVTSDESGVANGITFGESGDALGLTLGTAELIPPEDAAFTINGVAVTRPTNEVSDVITGVNLQLVGLTQVGEADTNIQVTQDTAGTKAKLQEFVDSYNKVVDVVNKELTYSGTTKDGSSLFGDSTLRQLQRTLGTNISTNYTNGAEQTSLGILGIEMDNTGKLSIDSTKLDNTLSSDPRAIDNIFAGDGGNDGVAKVLQDMVDTYTQSSTGLLSSKTDSLNSRIKVFDTQIERIEQSAAALSEQLNRQFAALEQAMSELNSQQSFLGAVGF
jgi:flagellar hook-associated protein 2